MQNTSTPVSLSSASEGSWGPCPLSKQCTVPSKAGWPRQATSPNAVTDGHRKWGVCFSKEELAELDFGRDK